MSYEATLAILQSHNYPSFRIRYLEYILHGFLLNKLYSREEIRKYYYEGMAAYYAVDHSNQNKSEAIIEANLVDEVESAFLKAVNRRELTEAEKQKIKEEHGPDSIAVFASARITNEENYLVQKFARAVLGTNNVDHCARL